jgi:hypothetical protein
LVERGTGGMTMTMMFESAAPIIIFTVGRWCGEVC